MTRRIITEQMLNELAVIPPMDVGGSQPSVPGEHAQLPDDYWSKIVKFIPGDIVAAWLLAKGMLESQQTAPAVMWGTFIFGLAITAIWVWNRTEVKGMPAATKQVAVSTLGFFVWAFALGTPFTQFAWYTSIAGALALLAFTLLTGALKIEN